LYKAVTNLSTKDYRSYIDQYFVEKKKIKELLSDNDYRYFSFQIWQEGLARYTEFSFLKLLLKYRPSKEVQSLPDFVAFRKLKSTMFDDELRHLLNSKIEENKRVSFYSLGFAEGILLDKEHTEWRKKYLTDKFYTEHYFN
jgi:hypothetical protein